MNETPERHHDRRKWTRYVVVCLLASVVLPLLVKWNNSQKGLQPLYKSINPDNEKTEAFTFQCSQPGKYDIAFEFEAGANDIEIAKLVGDVATPSPIGIRWEVRDETGIALAVGTFTEFSYLMRPKLVGQMIRHLLSIREFKNPTHRRIIRGVGSFTASSNEKLEIEILYDDIPDVINTSNPNVSILASRQAVRDVGQQASGVIYFSGLMMLAGLGLLITDRFLGQQRIKTIDRAERN